MNLLLNNINNIFMVDVNEILDEINFVRNSPIKYIEYLTELLNYFKNNNILLYPYTKIGIQTKEGKEAVNEAIDFLSIQSDFPTVEMNKYLNKIAEKYIEKIKYMDVNDIDKEDLENEINQYGEYSGYFGRSIEFGGENAKQVIVNLIVCDGDEDRSQRESLFNETIKYVGIATSKHIIYGNCTVILYTTKFKPNKIFKKEGKKKVKKEEKKEENENENEE